MRSLLRTLLAPLVLIAVPVVAAAQTPSTTLFACLSPQRAFSESEIGKAAIARLTALQDEKAQQIDERNKALQTEEQTLQQSAPLLSDTARAQRTQELEKFRLDVQRFIEDAQAEVTGVQRDTETAFLARLKPAVERVAQEKKLQIVFNLDAGSILWADSSLDITPEVIEQLASQ
jgi:outer membrane protein